MDDPILSQAITKLRIKAQPKELQTVLAPEEPHRQLFNLLEVWDADREDPEFNDKAKFIHDFLTDEQGTARDKIMSLLNELPSISHDKTLDRVYKWCRLKDEYRKVVKRAEVINQRIRSV